MPITGPLQSRRLLNLPRPVWLLGWVSLATDAASEAIYPLLPVFLTQVLGASAVSLGVVEGAADAANSVLKILSGRAADRARSKRPLVLAGYAVSSLARPLIAFAGSWTHVLAIRIVDRVGKGVREAPRDAMLAMWATPTTRGTVYGVHQAMDHTGAVIGPVLATAFLLFSPGNYRTLFSLTVIPGAIAVVLILFVREDARSRPQPSLTETVGSASRRENGQAWGADVGTLPRELTAFFLVLALFSLASSSDAFLLLKLGDAAGSSSYVPLMWAALHVVKASVAVAGGRLSDRVGRRPVIAAGWVVYAMVYAGFALASSLGVLLAWFLVYGLYFGLAGASQKALVADLAPEHRRGFAFGLYNAVLGGGALVASVVFGILWTTLGSAVAFGVGAGVALLATVLLFVAGR